MAGVDVGTAYLTVVPSAKGFAGKLQADIGGDLSSAGAAGGKSYGSGMLGAVKSFAAPMAGIFAVSGAVDFLKDSISEARESQKVGALTEQVIKSTGGAAQVTADQVGNLATAISNKTGIDDEQIQASENMLLTFTNVKNAVGDGNDIFNQATQTVTDMSAALGQDGKSSAIQLGKALNDPIKGITALQRVGVSFTEQQKDQIKAMVASGDTLGAQKMILGELNKEFGGAAAAQATAGDKMQTTWKNFQEAVGTALLPVLDAVLGKGTELVGWLTENLGPAISTVSTFIQPAVDGIKGFFSSLSGEGGDGTSSVFGQIGDFFHDTLPPAIATAQEAFGAIAAFVTTEVVPRVMGIVDAIRGFVTVAIPIVRQFVAGMRARIEPLLPQVKAIFGTMGQIVTTALELIRAVIERVTTVIAWIWANWGEGIMTLISVVWEKVIGIIGPALELIRNIFTTVMAAVHGDWSGVWDGLKSIVSAAWDVIKAIITGALGIIELLLGAAWGAITMAASAAWDAITGAVYDAWEDLKGEVSDALAAIGGALSTAWEAIKSAVSSAWDAVTSAIYQAWESIKSAVSTAVAAVTAWLSGAWETVKAAVSAAWDSVTGFIAQAWEGIKATVSGAVAAVLGILSAGWENVKANTAAAWDLVKNGIATVWEAIKTVVNTAIDAVVSFLATRWENLKANVSAAWEAIKGFISSAWEEIKAAASGGVDGVISFIAGLPGRALTALGDLTKTLLSAGGDLIAGFIQGIKDKAGDIIDAIKSAITDKLPDFVKTALRISSPSRVFMRLGAFTAQGMALGIASGADRVQAAADSLVPSLTPPAFGTLAVPVNSAGTVGAGVGGVEQVFNGNIVAHDYNDFVSQMQRRARLGQLGVSAT